MKKLFSIFLILFGLTVHAQSSTIDSLIHVIETTESDTVKISTLQEWDNLIYISDPKLDNQINLQIIEIASAQLEQKSNLSNKETSFYQYSMSTSYNILGINEDNNGNYPKALDFYYESLKIAEELDENEIVGNVYGNIGLIHEKLGDYDLAYEFYIKSLNIVHESEDHDAVVTAYNNIGSLYLLQDQNDSSLFYYRKALHVANENENEYHLATALGNIGVVYEQIDNFDSSLFYYNSSLEVREQINDWDGLSNVLSNIGLIYVQKKDPRTAIKYCRRGYQIAVKNNGAYRTSLNCNCLYQSFKISGDSDSALYYHEQLDSLNHSLINDENNRIIAQKEIIYQHEKQVYKDSLEYAGELQLREETLEKNKAQDRLRTTLLVSGLITLSLLGLIIYFRLAVAKKQKKEIEKQYKINAEQKEEIEQSINYAKLIQDSTLPTLNHDDIFKDSFIYYNPKDAVSGDFYWIEEDENHKYFAVADCTGHGIPGAFISMIGTILLNEIYNSKKITTPNLILNELNRLMELTLDSGDHHMKDGMDIAFCTLDKKTNKLHFAGANNPVWIISDKSELVITKNGTEITTPSKIDIEGKHLIEIKADKSPIGKSYVEHKNFTLNSVQVAKGDKVFVFSDGFADQFGGEKGKKYKYKPFKILLLKNVNKSMTELNKTLNSEFIDWKGELEQIDDVCIMGVEV